MPLSPQEQQELAELEELERLEVKHGNKVPSSNNEYGGLESATEHAANTAMLGYAPQAAGALSPITTRLARFFMKDQVNPRTGQTIPKEQLIPDESYLQARDKEVRKLQDMSTQNPGSSLVGSLAGGALTLPAVGWKGGAALGAAYNPGDKEGEMAPIQVKDRTVNAAIGGVAGGIADKLAQFLKGSSTSIQKRALGLNRFKSLDEATQNQMAQHTLDKGIWGTRARMQNKIAQELPEAESKLQNLLKSGPNIPSEEVASNFVDLVNRRKSPSGIIPESLNDDIARIIDRGKEISARGDVSPQDALSLARMAEANAYKVAPGEVKPGIMPELGRAEGRGYKELLEKAIPGTKDALTEERALILARQGLGKAPQINSRDINLDIMAAAALGNPKLAVAGALSKAPLVSTGVAKGLQQLSKVPASASTPSLIQLLESKRRNKR